MASAMLPVLESPFYRNLAGQPLRESGAGFQFAYRATSNSLIVTAYRGPDRTEASVKWVLGAGAQGETPLLEAGNATFESRVSFFTRLGQYGITVGEEGGASSNAASSLGRRLNSKDLAECVGCHSTEASPDLTSVLPGVQCEKCHPGANRHSHGQGMPVNPGKMPAATQVQFCGNCHRNRAPVDDTQLENFRFQPLRLMKSRCFLGGKLACTTCHIAHQDARRSNSAFYNTQCRSCHAAGTLHTDTRATGDCIGCHMPYVQLHPGLRFTDHFIRVVRAGDMPEGIVRTRGGG
jgi:hypothetical protein